MRTRAARTATTQRVRPLRDEADPWPCAPSPAPRRDDNANEHASTNGNADEHASADEYANANGGLTIGLTGFDGGKLRQMAKYSVNMNIDDMQISEDLHMMLDHLSMKVITNNMISETLAEAE